VLGFKELGGWDEMMRVCGAVTVNDYGDTMTNLIRSNDDANFPWLGALIGSAIIGFWYWCTDQFIVQRVLSGKNEMEARRGTIFGAYLKLLPVFLFLIPGMIAFALHQKYIGAGGEGFLPMLANGTANADAAFPTLVAKLLPAGVKGLVVCGILAALMSSLASLFNSSAMLFTIDFYKRFKPENRKLVEHFRELFRFAVADYGRGYTRELVLSLVNGLVYGAYEMCGAARLENLSLDSSRSRELFRNFMELLHEHLTREHEVQFYAGKLCISSKYLTQVSKGMIGRTPKQIIDETLMHEY
jgi:hypothetical protein